MRKRMGLWLLSLVGSGLWVHGDVLAFLTQIGFHPSCCLPAADHGAGGLNRRKGMSCILVESASHDSHTFQQIGAAYTPLQTMPLMLSSAGTVRLMYVLPVTTPSNTETQPSLSECVAVREEHTMLSAYITLSTAAPQSAHGGTGLLYASNDIWSTARHLTASTTDRDDADAAASAVQACHDGQSSVDRWGQTDCMTRASEGRAPDRRRSGMEAGATTTHPLPPTLLVVALMALRSCGGVASLRSSTLTPPAAATGETGEDKCKGGLEREAWV